MLTATLSSKGQLTLPKPLRDAFQLRTGSRVLFTLKPDGAILISDG
jgi:antitoxin PrlF